MALSNSLWRGPEVDGVTQSLLTSFCECPYRFYLYSVLGLQENVPLHPNLIWGDVFHKGLEYYIHSKDLNQSVTSMTDYLSTTYPSAPSTYGISTKGMLQQFRLAPYAGDWETEISFCIPLTLSSGRTVQFRGKKDAFCSNHPEMGRVLGEHKCKGYIDIQQTKRELPQDLQINVYAYLHNIEWINYDLILIPESVKYAPSRSYNETPQAHMLRLIQGPCGNYNLFPVLSNKHLWQQQCTIHHPREAQEAYWNFTVLPLLDRICQFWDHVTTPGFDPNSPASYNHLFYRMPVRMFNGSFTEKFECRYHKLLIGESTLADLIPVPSLFSELENL